MPNPFDLLSLAEGEYGEAAVAIVVGAANPDLNPSPSCKKGKELSKGQENVRAGHSYNYEHYNRCCSNYSGGYGYHNKNYNATGYYNGGYQRMHQGNDQYQRNRNYYNDGGYGQYQAENYSDGHNKKKNFQYMPKEKHVSGTSSTCSAENKTEEKLVELGSKECTRDVAKDDSKKEGGDPEKKEKGNRKCVSGSLKKKLRKKRDVKGKTGKGPEITEVFKDEEKTEITLEEYEKMREEKRKTLDASKSEGRKVTSEVFEGMQLLEKKNLEDGNAAKKAENKQRKEGGVKQAKTPKAINLNDFIKPTDGQAYYPRPRRVQENFSQQYCSGGFRQNSRDNSSEPQRDNGGRGGNSRGNSGYQVGYQQGGFNGNVRFHQNREVYYGNGGYQRDQAYPRSNGGNHQGRGYSSNNGVFHHGRCYFSNNDYSINGGNRRGGHQGNNDDMNQSNSVLSAANLPALTGSSPASAGTTEKVQPAPAQAQAQTQACLASGAKTKAASQVQTKAQT